MVSCYFLCKITRETTPHITNHITTLLRIPLIIRTTTMTTSPSSLAARWTIQLTPPLSTNLSVTVQWQLPNHRHNCNPVPRGYIHRHYPARDIPRGRSQTHNSRGQIMMGTCMSRDRMKGTIGLVMRMKEEGRVRRREKLGDCIRGLMSDGMDGKKVDGKYRMWCI